MDKNTLDKAAADLAEKLRSVLQDKPRPEVLGPQSPLVGRIQKMHLMTLLIKLPRSPEIVNNKEKIAREIEKTRSDKSYGKLFIIPDVDPY